jgi:hypothetical protein
MLPINGNELRVCGPLFLAVIAASDKFGKRRTSWISYIITSARICPTPGMDRSRYKVW